MKHLTTSEPTLRVTRPPSRLGSAPLYRPVYRPLSCVSLALSLSLSLVGCEPQREGPTSSPAESGTSSGVEAGASAGVEAGASAGVEAGASAGVEAGVSAGVEAGAQPPLSALTTLDIYEGLKPSCSLCHGQGQSLPAFESLSSFERLIVADERWVVPGEPTQSGLLALLRGVGEGRFTEMPPGASYASRLPQLSEQTPRAPTLQELSDWIELMDPNATITPSEEVACAALPSALSLTRLSRGDYQRAVEDLLNTQLNVSEGLPAENESYSFAHLSALLSFSPLLIEKYELAALALAEEALPDRHPNPSELLFEGEEMSATVGASNGQAWNLWSVGDLSTDLTLERGGEYEVRVSVAGTQVGPDPTRFALKLNDVTLTQAESAAQTPAYETVSLRVNLPAGSHTLALRFLNDYYCTEAGVLEGRCPEAGDRNLFVNWVMVRGPLYVEAPPSSFEARFLSCSWEEIRSGELSDEALEGCARQTIDRFVRLAWRGVVSEAERDRLWALVSAELEGSEDRALGLARGLRQAVQAALLSPRFLVREELSAAGQPLSDHERAARLAALVWRSVPDAPLLQAAAQGELRSEAGLRTQLERLLSAPRASSLIDEFAMRFLNIHHLEAVAPDYDAFPDFDEPLRAAMREETRLTLLTLLEEGRPFLDLINADFTWLNPRLAEHYGLSELLDPNVREGFQRVALPQGGRLGALTQGAWLTLTSHPTRTSPVVRGKWVLENLLCMPPPPPPPGVEGLPPAVNQDNSVRARLEQHRADPACAACHLHMDTIGFGLERFDGVGAFRLTDAGRVIETAGRLPPYLAEVMGAEMGAEMNTGEDTGEGVSFEDAVSLVSALRQDPRVGRCVAERFVIYALGRGLLEDERCLLDEVLTQAEQGGFTLEALVSAVVFSPLFLTRGEAR